MKEKYMNNDLKLLNAMADDQERQSNPLYRPGFYWRGYCMRVFDAIKKYGLDEFRSNEAISKGYADSAPLDPAALWDGISWKLDIVKRFIRIPIVKRRIIVLYQDLINNYYNEMRPYRQYYFDREFGEWYREMGRKYLLPDTMVGRPNEFVSLGGSDVSIAYIRQLLRIHNISQSCDFSKVRTVFEIGGGFGVNAHLMLSMFPNIRKYLYLDIVPVLYVATQYLKHFYPDAVVDYLATKDADTIRFKDDDSLEILCVCPWQIANAKAQGDLFWNSCSFQEMSPEIIANYAVSANRLMAQGSTACLAMYTPKISNKLVPIETILSSFSKSFLLKRMEPLKTDEKKSLEYYVGKKM